MFYKCQKLRAALPSLQGEGRGCAPFMKLIEIILFLSCSEAVTLFGGKGTQKNRKRKTSGLIFLVTVKKLNFTRLCNSKLHVAVALVPD